MGIVELIKQEFMVLNQKYIDESDDKYNFWEQHIKYVLKEALRLAQEYKADKEIVELGALLHDIALVSKVGTKEDHHINGAIIAENLLNKFNYPKDKLKRVVGCVLHHRRSQYAENIEELCVADADILAHYDNIVLCFYTAFKFNKIADVNDKNQWIKYFQKDYYDLSERTKETFKDRYLAIMNVLFSEM